MSIEEGIIEKFQTDLTINIDHLQERFLIDVILLTCLAPARATIANTSPQRSILHRSSS